jgi:hypothetical protein
MSSISLADKIDKGRPVSGRLFFCIAMTDVNLLGLYR